MKSTTIARSVGLVSIAFGIVDTLFSEKFGKAIGAGDKGKAMFGAAGARELATGLAAISAPANPAPLWGRFVGDLSDIVAVGAVAVQRGNGRRKMALLTLGIVVAVAVVDFAAARAVGKARTA